MSVDRLNSAIVSSLKLIRNRVSEIGKDLLSVTENAEIKGKVAGANQVCVRSRSLHCLSSVDRHPLQLKTVQTLLVAFSVGDSKPPAVETVTAADMETKQGRLKAFK
jgi:hypothetical protein